MDAYRVVDLPCIPAGHGEGHGQAVLPAAFEHPAVPFGQPCESQRQPPEAVVPVGVGAGQVDDEVGAGAVEGGAETPVEAGEVGAIAAAVGKLDVEVAFRLGKREVAGAVDGEGVDAVVAGQDGGGAVALMHVAIDHQHPADAALGLQGAGGDGGVVEDAEAFPPVPVGMVGAARQVGGDAIGQGGPAGAQGGAGGAAGAFDHGGAPGKTDGFLFPLAQTPGGDAPDVVRVVGTGQGGVVGRFGKVEIGGGKFAAFRQDGPQPGIFFHGKAVAGGQGQDEDVGVEELHGGGAGSDASHYHAGMANLEISATGPELRLVLGGRLDAAGVAPLWPEARAALAAQSGRAVVVDAAGVEYCDGAGLAFLVDLLRQERPAEAAVRIVGLAERFDRLLAQFDVEQFRQPLVRPVVDDSLLHRIGLASLELAADLKTQVAFIGEAGRALAAAARSPGRVRWGDALAIAEEAGVNALPIVTLVAFILGVILAYQSAVAMRQFGAEVYVADLIGISMVRELAPLMTAILLAGRSGAAFAAEIGTMRVNEEIDALSTFGFDPVRFLVVTRVLAALAVTPLLAVYADVVSIAGGALVLLSFQVPLATYFNEVFTLVGMSDLFTGLFKCGVFGVVIAGIGCLRGLQTGSGAAAVGISTTRAVVSALVLIVVVDGSFAIVFYHLGL